MRWDDTFTGGHECYKWYDLLADNGGLLGYIRENLVSHTFVACINESSQQVLKFDNLEDAKNHIIAYYVTQKLEGT